MAVFYVRTLVDIITEEGTPALRREFYRETPDAGEQPEQECAAFYHDGVPCRAVGLIARADSRRDLWDRLGVGPSNDPENDDAWDLLIYEAGPADITHCSEADVTEWERSVEFSAQAAADRWGGVTYED